MEWFWEILKLLGIVWKKKQAADAAATLPSIDASIEAAEKSSKSVKDELNKPPLK